MLDERHGLAGEALDAKSDAQEAQILQSYDQDTCDRVAAELAPTKQVQVPTLVLPHAESEASSRNPERDPRWPYLRADERTRWQRIEKDLTPQERAVAMQRWPVARRIVATLHAAGVTVLAGTDTPMPNVYPGYSLHEEMELLVASGLSPAQALRLFYANDHGVWQQRATSDRGFHGKRRTDPRAARLMPTSRTHVPSSMQ